MLILLLVPAFRSTLAHLRGEGACCGGPREKARKKHSERTLHVEGMRCENCRIRLESRLNPLDGVIARADLAKKCVWISLCREIPEEELIRVITDLGFRVR